MLFLFGTTTSPKKKKCSAEHWNKISAIHFVFNISLFKLNLMLHIIFHSYNEYAFN